MPTSIRELSLEDLEHINILCKTIWNGNDYVPAIFPNWVANPLARTVGLFEAGKLVAFGNIEKHSEADIAWIQGLRVKEGHRSKGHATTITLSLISIAKELGIKHLWYATSSRNESSIKVAEKSGFHEVDRTGYFRIYKPYPAHAKPSPSIVPLKVSPERLHELLNENPDLVRSSTFPLVWHFDFKTKEGLTRLLRNSVIKVVVDDTGRALGFYCLDERERNEEKTAAFTVFATDRSVFVDIMSRMIDQAETIGADRAVFFLDPRVTEWALDLGYVADEFVERKFLLYEWKPPEK
ncbi:MAG: GNAT family N-acetyltransferase [Candidatus Thorarchaeota archaeon]|jgi:N-acetylglutamate synthase-like GNAT family acetyltransferase